LQFPSQLAKQIILSVDIDNSILERTLPLKTRFKTKRKIPLILYTGDFLVLTQNQVLAFRFLVIFVLITLGINQNGKTYHPNHFPENYHPGHPQNHLHPRRHPGQRPFPGSLLVFVMLDLLATTLLLRAAVDCRIVRGFL
jgi:hypothetical protein